MDSTVVTEHYIYICLYFNPLKFIDVHYNLANDRLLYKFIKNEYFAVSYFDFLIYSSSLVLIFLYILFIL